MTSLRGGRGWGLRGLRGGSYPPLPPPLDTYDSNIPMYVSFTGGTLKPMETFQAELDTDFPIRFQNDHVIDANKQINFQVISQGG